MFFNLNCLKNVFFFKLATWRLQLHHQRWLCSFIFKKKTLCCSKITLLCNPSCEKYSIKTFYDGPQDENSLMKHCSLTAAPLYFTLPPFHSSVSCWWTAWPCTATAAPSASRWRRSWSNSPETSTVPFRWETSVWRSAAHSHSRQLERTISTAGVKGTSRGGKEKKKCKIPNVSGGRHFCPFWTWMQQNRWRDVWGGGSWSDGSSCSVPSLCVQSSQSASSSEDSCEGAQAYPPTPPIMLQVSCKSCAQLTVRITSSGEPHGAACVSVVVPPDLRRRFDCSGLPLKLLSSRFDSSLTPRRSILVQQMERFLNLLNSTYPSAKRACRKDGKKW